MHWEGRGGKRGMRGEQPVPPVIGTVGEGNEGCSPGKDAAARVDGLSSSSAAFQECST